jgi:hypothetical protein
MEPALPPTTCCNRPTCGAPFSLSHLLPTVSSEFLFSCSPTVNTFVEEQAAVKPNNGMESYLDQWQHGIGQSYLLPHSAIPASYCCWTTGGEPGLVVQPYLNPTPPP